MLKSVDFGRFMMQDGIDTFILAYTSKTGKSVEHYRHIIFVFEFFEIELKKE